MAQCPHCQFETFRVEEHSLRGSDLLYALICCDNCGAPISVLERENVNSALEQQDEIIDQLAVQVGQLDAKLDRALQQLEVIRERLRELLQR